MFPSEWPDFSRVYEIPETPGTIDPAMSTGRHPPYSNFQIFNAAFPKIHARSSSLSDSK